MQRLAAETAERQQRDAQKLAAKRAQRAQREQARAQAAQDKAQKAAASAGLRVGRNASVQNVTMFPTKPAAPAPQGQAVETAATVRTVDDTKRPIARWQTQQLPADPRWPSFSAAPLGVNPDTGRPWA